MKVGFQATGSFSCDGILYLGSSHVTLGGIYTFDGKTILKMRDGRTRSLALDASDRLWATLIDPDTGDMCLMVQEEGVWSDRTDEIEFLKPITTNELTVQTDPDGTVWVSNLGKYGYYRDGEWTFHDGGGVPVFLVFDRSGDVWGYGYKKLYRLDPSGNWEQVLLMETGTINNPNFLTMTTDLTVWTFDSNTVYRYVNNKWNAVESRLDLASDIVTCLVYMDNGDLMCGHGLRGQAYRERKNQGISIRVNSTWNNYNEFGDVDLLNIYQLERMPDGNIMAYTDGGFKMYDGTKWVVEDSLSGYKQNDMLWDSEETMWIATQRGLVEYNGQNPILHILYDENYYTPVNNLAVDENDMLYVHIYTGDIITYYSAEWFLLVTANALTDDFVIADDGTIWATRRTHIEYWDAGIKRWQPFVILDKGRFIHIDDIGRIWASGYGNTGYLENSTWHSIPELSEYASDAIATSDEGYVALNIFGSERKNFYGLYEFIQSTGIQDSEEKPKQFITNGNYPNPFNAYTKISFDLPFQANVKVMVYSITGQHIKTLAESRFPAGRNSVIWDGTSPNGKDSASGVYLYRIQAGNIAKTGKMLLLR